MNKISIPLNAENQAVFQPVAGKSVKIQVKGTALDLYLTIHATELCLSREACEFQLELIGAPFTLLKILLRAKQDEASWGNITVQGDVLFAEALSKAIRRAHIDWESWLAKYLGDFPAVQLTLFGTKTTTWSRQTADRLLKSLSEYWQEEARYTPTQIELDEFVNAVDTLQDDVARLEARIKQLTKA